MRQEPNGRLILEPIVRGKLSSLLDSWDSMSDSETMLAIDDLPADTVRL